MCDCGNNFSPKTVQALSRVYRLYDLPDHLHPSRVRGTDVADLKFALCVHVLSFAGGQYGLAFWGDLQQSMVLLIRSLRVGQVGLLLLLFAVSRSLGLSWRSYSFGLSLGYGTYAAVDFVVMAIRALYGGDVWKLLNTVGSLAYSVALFVWAGYFFLQPQEVAQPDRTIPHYDIEKWNEKLEEQLKRKMRRALFCAPKEVSCGGRLAAVNKFCSICSFIFTLPGVLRHAY
jgi:hypothetical protein